MWFAFQSRHRNIKGEILGSCVSQQHPNLPTYTLFSMVFIWYFAVDVNSRYPHTEPTLSESAPSNKLSSWLTWYQPQEVRRWGLTAPAQHQPRAAPWLVVTEAVCVLLQIYRCPRGKVELRQLLPCYNFSNNLCLIFPLFQYWNAIISPESFESGEITLSASVICTQGVSTYTWSTPCAVVVCISELKFIWTLCTRY